MGRGGGGEDIPRCCSVFGGVFHGDVEDPLRGGERWQRQESGKLKVRWRLLLSMLYRESLRAIAHAALADQQLRFLLNKMIIDSCDNINANDRTYMCAGLRPVCQKKTYIYIYIYPIAILAQVVNRIA